MFILRQLEFGLFDFRLHTEYSPQKSGQILSTLQSVKQQVAVVPSPEWSRFPHAFSHILLVVMRPVTIVIYGPTF